MRFLLTADLHCQNQPAWKLEYYRKLLREIVMVAREQNCDAVVCAGDLWHEKHGVNAELLQMVYFELDRSADMGIPWVLLRGNHEIAMKSKPHDSLLALFAGISTVVMKPRALRWSDCTMYLLPWYLGDTFKDYAKRMAQATVGDTQKKKILIGHIGLNEGFVSPSNCYRVPQRVSLANLHPECYNLVFLGDYHTTQTLGDRTMYAGSPIAHQFGDAPDQGVWLLDTGGPELRISNLKLSGSYPVYKAIKIPQGFGVPTLKAKHHVYRLQVHIEDFPKVKHLLANDTVDIETYGERKVDATARRLENIKPEDPIALFRALLDHKDIQDPLYRDIGEHAIKRAKGELYGKEEQIAGSRVKVPREKRSYPQPNS